MAGLEKKQDDEVKSGGLSSSSGTSASSVNGGGTGGSIGRSTGAPVSIGKSTSGGKVDTSGGKSFDFKDPSTFGGNLGGVHADVPSSSSDTSTSSGTYDSGTTTGGDESTSSGPQEDLSTDNNPVKYTSESVQDNDNEEDNPNSYQSSETINDVNQDATQTTVDWTKPNPESFVGQNKQQEEEEADWQKQLEEYTRQQASGDYDYSSDEFRKYKTETNEDHVSGDRRWYNSYTDFITDIDPRIESELDFLDSVLTDNGDGSLSVGAYTDKNERLDNILDIGYARFDLEKVFTETDFNSVYEAEIPNIAKANYEAYKKEYDEKGITVDDLIKIFSDPEHPEHDERRDAWVNATKAELENELKVVSWLWDTAVWYDKACSPYDYVSKDPVEKDFAAERERVGKNYAEADAAYKDALAEQARIKQMLIDSGADPNADEAFVKAGQEVARTKAELEKAQTESDKLNDKYEEAIKAVDDRNLEIDLERKYMHNSTLENWEKSKADLETLLAGNATNEMAAQFGVSVEDINLYNAYTAYTEAEEALNSANKNNQPGNPNAISAEEYEALQQQKSAAEAALKRAAGVDVDLDKAKAAAEEAKKRMAPLEAEMEHINDNYYGLLLKGMTEEEKNNLWVDLNRKSEGYGAFYGDGNINMYDRMAELAAGADFEKYLLDPNADVDDIVDDVATAFEFYIGLTKDGKHVLIPAMVKNEDGEWEHVDRMEAFKYNARTGENFGTYDTVEEAQAAQDRLVNGENTKLLLYRYWADQATKYQAEAAAAGERYMMDKSGGNKEAAEYWKKLYNYAYSKASEYTPEDKKALIAFGKEQSKLTKQEQEIKKYLDSDRENAKKAQILAGKVAVLEMSVGEEGLENAIAIAKADLGPTAKEYNAAYQKWINGVGQENLTRAYSASRMSGSVDFETWCHQQFEKNNVEYTPGLQMQMDSAEKTYEEIKAEYDNAFESFKSDAFNTYAEGVQNGETGRPKSEKELKADFEQQNQELTAQYNEAKAIYEDAKHKADDARETVDTLKEFRGIAVDTIEWDGERPSTKRVNDLTEDEHYNDYVNAGLGFTNDVIELYKKLSNTPQFVQFFTSAPDGFANFSGSASEMGRTDALRKEIMDGMDALGMTDADKAEMNKALDKYDEPWVVLPNDNWSYQEICTFAYYMGSGDIDTALEYAHDQNVKYAGESREARTQKIQEFSRQMTEKLNQDGFGNKALGTAWTAGVVAANAVNSALLVPAAEAVNKLLTIAQTGEMPITYGVGVTESGRALIGGAAGVLDENDWAMRIAGTEFTLGEVYQSVSSMVESMAMGKVGAVIGASFGASAGAAEKIANAYMNLAFGSSAFLDAVDEAYEQTGDIGKSLIIAGGAAFCEAFFEKASLEILFDKIMPDISNFATLALNTGVFSLVEGSEEVFTDIGNLVIESIAAGDMSKYKQLYNDLTDPNGPYQLSADEAERIVKGQIKDQLVISGLSGMLSAGPTIALHGAKEWVHQSKTGGRVLSNDLVGPMVTSIKEALNTPEAFSYDELSGNAEQTTPGPQPGTKEQEQAVEDMWDRGEKAQPPAEAPAETPAAQPGTPEQVEAVEDMWDRGEKAQPPKTAEEQAAEDEVTNILEGKTSPSRRDAEKIAKTPALKKAFERMYNVTLKGYVSGMVDTIRTAYAEQQQKQAAAEQAAGKYDADGRSRTEAEQAAQTEAARAKYDADGRARTEAEQTAQTEAARDKYDADGRARTEAEQTAQTEAARNKYEADGKNRTDAETKKAQQELLEEAEALDNEIKSRMQAQSEKAIALQAEIDGLNQKLEAGTITSAEQKRLDALLKQQEKNVAMMNDLAMKAGQLLNKFRETLPEAFKNFILTNAEKYANVNQGELARAAMEAKAGAINAQSDLAAYYAQIDNPDAVVLEEVGATLQAEFGLSAKEAHDVQGAVSAIVHGATGVYGIGVTGIRSFANSEAMKSPKVRQAVVSYVNSLIKDGVIHLAKPNNEQRNISSSSGTTSTPHVIPGSGRTSSSVKKVPTTTNGFINSIKTALTGMPEHFKTLINRMTGTTVQEAVEENVPGDKIPERVKPAEIEEIGANEDIADVLTQVWAYVALENEIRKKSGQRSDTLAETIKGRNEAPNTVAPAPQKSVIPAAQPTMAQRFASASDDNIYERAKRLPIPPKADTSMPGREQDNQHAAQPMAQSPSGPVNTEERTAVFASALTQDIKDLLDKQIKIGKKPYNFFSYYNMRKKDAPAITRELAAEEFRLVLAGNDFNKVVDYVAKKYKTDTNRTGSQPDTKTKATKENSADVTHPRNNEDWYQTSPESPKVTRAQFVEDETKNGKSPAEANEEFDRIMHSIEQDKAFPGEVHYAETKEATPKEQARAAVKKKPKLLARLNMTLDDLQKRVDNKRTALIELEKQYDKLSKNDKATPEQKQALWGEVSRATVDLSKDIGDLNILRNRKGLSAVESRTIDQRIKDQQKIVDQAVNALSEYTANSQKNGWPVDTKAIHRLFTAMQAEVDKLNELKREKENEGHRNKNNSERSDTGVNESDTRNAEELSANDGRGQEGTTEKSEGTRSVVLNFPDRSIQITNGTVVWDSSSATNESALTSTEREFVNKVSQGNADRVILVDAETLEFIFPGGKHELNGYFTITSGGQRIVVANVNEDLRHGYHENKHSLLSALDEANRRAYLSKAFENIFGKDQEAYENLLSFYTQLYRPAFSSKFKLTAAQQKALTDYVMEEIYADLSVGYDRMLASVGASVFENADITPYMERAQAFEDQYRLQDYANDNEDFYSHNEDGTRSSDKRGILPAEMTDGKAAYDIESRQTQGYTRAQRYIANKISQGRAGGEVQGKASFATVTIPTPVDVQPEIFNITGDPRLEDRFSQATEKTPLPKQDIALTASGSVTKTTRMTDNGELYLATVRDLRNQAFRENDEFMAKYGEKGILEFNKLLDVVGDYLQEAGETFHYLDLADINSATLSIDPMTNEINLSSMVSNGDYEVNFDFGTICERRQALQSLVDNLLLNATYDKNGRASVQLNATTLHQINEMLAKEGINTACLICFVETKRYGQQNQFGEFTTMWNKEVRKALKELGMEAQFFDFKHGVEEMSKEHQINRRKAVEAKNAATREANAQKKERGEKAGETTKEAVERMVKAIAENSPEDLKLLDTGDLQSMPGRTTLAQNFPELDSLVKKKGGSAAPKPVYGFSPYNGELESLRYTGDSGTLQDHIREIAGVRSQSFSDFIITHVFDHMQKTGGMASRNLRGHTYTKVPARAELFGKTGEKINMSILFDIRPDINPWYAGLNAETQDLTVDLAHPRNRPYNFSDYRAKEQGDTNWVQSFPWDRAVALQNTPGFSKNVGTIGVALSYWHYKHLLADPEIRQVIGYHSSSYPKDIKDITHIDNATDYSAVQNILHFNGFVKPNYEIPAGTPSYASRPASVDAGDNTLVTAVDDNKYKDLKAVFRQRLKENPGKPRGKVAVALMQEILNYADENGYAFSTNKVKSEGAHGQFDLYGKNGGVEDTHDPRMTAENYIAYCLDKGYLPQFYEFSTDPNYYKQVFDFNMYDRITGEYAPQNPVSIYDENGESVFGSADELKKQLKAFMEEYNEQQRKTQSFINDPTFLEKVREITGDVSKMSLDVSEYDGVEEAAAEHFGTTGNYKVAGYLLQDGRMLDFSGAHWLGDVSQQEKDEWRRNNSRQVDHEDVFEAFEKNGNEFPSDSSLAFIQRGNIRMVPEIPGIEISELTEPTAKQYARIKDYIRTINQDPNNYYQNYFTVDLRTNRNTRPQSLKYEGTINPNKIVNDIKAFYRTGEVPQQSVVSQFHDRFSLAEVAPVQPSSDEWSRTIDSAEAKEQFPNLWDVTADESEVRNPTQIQGTVKTYRKIYDILKDEGFNGTILDASSGLGYGTRAGIDEYGFDVEDIEPYPDKSYNPKYTDYSALDKQYDVIISNAVLNVLPQDLRDALTVKMGQLLKPGGRMFINVRSANDVKQLAKNANNVAIGNGDYYVASSGSYQKGFTKNELKSYIQDALGEGYTVEVTNKFGDAAVVVQKNSNATQTNRYSLSKTDRQYMDAVNSDDMETAQAIVDNAAKKAGYKKHAYHGTLAYGFNEFRMISTSELGVHFGTEEAARVFYNNTYNRRGFGENPGIYDVYLKMENTLKTPDVWGDPEALDTIIRRVDSWVENGYHDHREGAEDVKWTKADSRKLRDALKINDDYYAYRDACDDWFEETRRLENPTEYIDPVTGKVYTYEETWDLADSEAAKLGLNRTFARDKEDGKKEYYATDSRRRKETLLFTLDAAYEGTAIQDRIDEAAWRANQLAQTYLKNLGFDSIRYINEMEDIGSESYIILEPTHIKSAEPVTYDDNGNIIPPSQRFDGDIKDIRFSLLHDVVDTDGNVYDDVVRVTYPWTRDILSSAEEFDYYVQQMMPGKEITTLDENGEKQVITFANADDKVIKHNFEHPALSELSSGRKTGVRSWLVYLNAQELLDNSTFDHHEPQNPDWWNNHDWFDKNGWDYRTAYMMDKYNKIYPVTLYIANTSDGRKILYHAAVTTPLAKDVDIPATAKNNPNENFRRFNKFPKPEGYVDRVPVGKEEVDATEERLSLSINEAFDEFGYDVQPEDTNPTDLTQSALSENLYYSEDGNTAYYQTPTGETVILNNVGTDSPEAQFINYLEANNNANSINTTTTEPYSIPAATRDEYDGYNLGEQDAGLRRGTEEIPSANQEGTLRRAGGTLQRNGQSGSQSEETESVDRFSFALGDDDGWAIYNDYGDEITYTDNYPYGSFYREIVDAMHNNTDIEDLKNYLEGMAQRVDPEDVDANLDMLRKIVDANPRMSDMERQNMYRTMEALQKKYGGFKVAKDDKKKNIPIPRKLDKDTKVMKFTKTVEANADTEWLTDETMKKVIEDAMMSYVPMSNEKAIKEAMRIWDRENGNFERLLRHLEDKLNMNDRITPVDVALGEYMLREAEANGRVNDAMRLVADLALMGHNTGQTLQAFRILKKLTPRGQLYYLNGVIKQLNERYKKDNPNIQIDEALVRKLLASQTRKELDDTMDEIKKNIAKQLPVHWWDRWNAWRYVAMLGNPRTHVRNAFGNGMFVPAVLLKDFIAAELENRTKWIDPNMRTKTLPSEYKNSAVFRKFALEQTEVMKDILSGKASGNKFTDVNEIIGMRDLWGSTPLGKAIKAWDETNSMALEAEDYFFLSRYFQRALMQFLQARGVTEQDLLNGFGGDRDSRKLLNEARAWAVLEAQRNTYRDANAAATQLNRLKRAGLVPYTLLEGAVPFTKTPLNILARGIEYSPIGLIKSAIMLGRDLRSGEYTTSEVLDRLAAGASGTAFTILGALFASIGWLRGSGPSDDELAEFEELQGHQNWAVEIGGRSYTIDWMAPAALPLFIGVNIMNMLQGDINIESAWDIGTAFARLAEPLSSLSMLDGINNLLTTMSTADKTERYSTLAWALLTSYISQGVPTILGQAARSMDPDQRRTYIDQNKSTPDALQRFIQSSLQAKIPGWESKRMAYVDAWGRTDSAETTGDWIWKVLENFLSPGYGNKINTTPVDEELHRLFDATGDNTIFPDMLAKKYNVNGEEKNLTAAEYEQLMRTSGATAYDIAYEVIMSPEYAQLDDAGKMKLLDQAFEYAKNYGKTVVTPEYEMSASWMDTAQKVGASDYIRMRSLLPQTYSNDQLFAYLAVNPNLSNEQIADIVADEFSAPRQLYSTGFTGYVYDITDEDKDAMQVVFRDNLYTELRKTFDSVEYNRADPRERGYLIDDAYEAALAKTKTDYSAVLDSEGRVKDLGRASSVGKEKWGVAINATEKTTAEQAKYLSDSYAPDHKIDNPDRLGYVFNLNESQYRDLKDEFAKEWAKDYDALLSSNAYLNAETEEDRENMVAAQFNKTSKEVEEAFARGLKGASGSIRPASDFANPDDRYDTVEYNEDGEEVDEELSDVKAGWKWTDVYKIASENFNSVEEMAEWMAGKMTGATSIDNPDRIGHKMVLDESQKATEARHEQDTFKKAAVKLMNDPSWPGLTDDEKAGALHDLEVAVAALEEGNYARYLIDNGYDYEDKRDVSSSTNQTFFTMLMTDDLTKDEVFDLLDQRYTSKVGTSIKGNSLSYVERAHRVDAYMEYIRANYDAFTSKYLTSDDEATLLKAATAFEKSLHKSGMSQSGNITAQDFGITTKVSADQNRENKKDPNWTFNRWMTNPIDFMSASAPYTSTGTTTTSSTTRPVIPPKNSTNTGRTYHWSSANRKIP